jgi:antitoxin ParD1/3/4
MNVSLTPELEKLVQEKVKSGRYLSASEVVREALRLLQEQDQLRELRLEELRKFVAVGVEQADRGQLAPLDVDATLARVRSRKAKVREGS